MALAARDSREALRRVLALAASSQLRFNLSAKNSRGSNLFHLLVNNNDKHSLKILLNQHLNAGEVLNCLDSSGKSPLMIAYSREHYSVADCIVNHPKQKSHINWKVKDSDGRVLTQLAEEAKRKRLEMVDSKMFFVQVSRKASKRNFPKENGATEVKEKQAKVTSQAASNNVNSLHNMGSNGVNDVAMDDASEELSWIQQMKRDKEEAERSAEAKRKQEELKRAEENSKNKPVPDLKPKKMTLEDKMKALKAKMEAEKNQASSAVSQTNQLENIAEAFEKKRQRRLAARNKMSEEERKEQEDKAVQQAMYEEIIWALKQKKEIAEQMGDAYESERISKLMKENEEKMDGTWERRIKQEAKEREEKEMQKHLEIERAKQAIEREKQEAKQKELDIIAKKKRDAELLVQQKKWEEERQIKEEENRFNSLPRWKKESILNKKRKEEEAILAERRADEEKRRVEEKKIEEAKLKEEDAILAIKRAEEEKVLEEERKIHEAKEQAVAAERKIIEDKRKVEEEAKQKEEQLKQQQAMRKIQEEEEARHREEAIIAKQEAEKKAAEEKHQEEIYKAGEEAKRKLEERFKQEEKIKVENEMRRKEKLKKWEDDKQRREVENLRQEEQRIGKEYQDKLDKERRLKEAKIKEVEDKRRAEQDAKQSEAEKRILERIRLKEIAVKEAQQKLMEERRNAEVKEKEEQEARHEQRRLLEEKDKLERDAKLKVINERKEEIKRKEAETKLKENEKNKTEECVKISETKRKLQEVKKRLEEGKEAEKRMNERMKIREQQENEQRQRERQEIIIKEAKLIEEAQLRINERKLKEERDKAEEETRLQEEKKIQEAKINERKLQEEKERAQREIRQKEAAQLKEEREKAEEDTRLQEEKIIQEAKINERKLQEEKEKALKEIRKNQEGRKEEETNKEQEQVEYNIPEYIEISQVKTVPGNGEVDDLDEDEWEYEDEDENIAFEAPEIHIKEEPQNVVEMLKWWRGGQNPTEATENPEESEEDNGATESPYLTTDKPMHESTELEMDDSSECNILLTSQEAKINERKLQEEKEKALKEIRQKEDENIAIQVPEIHIEEKPQHFVLTESTDNPEESEEDNGATETSYQPTDKPMHESTELEMDDSSEYNILLTSQEKTDMQITNIKETGINQNVEELIENDDKECTNLDLPIDNQKGEEIEITEDKEFVEETGQENITDKNNNEEIYLIEKVNELNKYNLSTLNDTIMSSKVEETEKNGVAIKAIGKGKENKEIPGIEDAIEGKQTEGKINSEISHKDTDIKLTMEKFDEQKELHTGLEENLGEARDSPEIANETIGKIETIGKGCDAQELDELIKLIQDKIEAARRQKELKEKSHIADDKQGNYFTDNKEGEPKCADSVVNKELTETRTNALLATSSICQVGQQKDVGMDKSNTSLPISTNSQTTIVLTNDVEAEDESMNLLSEGDTVKASSEYDIVDILSEDKSLNATSLAVDEDIPSVNEVEELNVKKDKASCEVVTLTASCESDTLNATTIRDTVNDRENASEGETASSEIGYIQQAKENNSEDSIKSSCSVSVILESTHSESKHTDEPPIIQEVKNKEDATVEIAWILAKAKYIACTSTENIKESLNSHPSGENTMESTVQASSDSHGQSNSKEEESDKSNNISNLTGDLQILDGNKTNEENLVGTSEPHGSNGNDCVPILPPIFPKRKKIENNIRAGNLLDLMDVKLNETNSEKPSEDINIKETEDTNNAESNEKPKERKISEEKAMMEKKRLERLISMVTDKLDAARKAAERKKQSMSSNGSE